MTVKKTKNSRTENQILLNIGEEKKFYDFLERADPSYLAKCQVIYQNQYMIYIAFDFDGTPDKNVLWDKMMKGTSYIVETNYLDGSLPWTRDSSGGEYELTFAWQIIQGELFPEILNKYDRQNDIFKDPIFVDGIIDYSNQEDIDWRQVEKLVNDPTLDFTPPSIACPGLRD